jgi:hypothetical protein
MAVINVSETLTTLEAATPPILNELMLALKPVPVIVTAVPPAVDPDAGEMAITVGVETTTVRVNVLLTDPLALVAVTV